MAREATKSPSTSPAKNDPAKSDAKAERRVVKSATEARQGGRPKQTAYVLAASLILAAFVAAVLAGVFSF